MFHISFSSYKKIFLNFAVQSPPVVDLTEALHTCRSNCYKIVNEPSVIILYQGHNLCIYYDKNSWTFTHIGKIENQSQSELKEFLNADGGSVKLMLAVE
ncbi:MAG: hypothetical protein IKP73_18280 [Bacteroidales bacterium]|nr:hypothetical protein [Bacteroidales bacterium]